MPAIQATFAGVGVSLELAFDLQVLATGASSPGRSKRSTLTLTADVITHDLTLPLTSSLLSVAGASSSSSVAKSGARCLFALEGREACDSEEEEG